MDLKELVVPFVWWTAAPQHRISCASAVGPITGEGISHLVTGSVTGEIVLWRRYKTIPESPRIQRNGSITAIERNIQLQVAEMKIAASNDGAERFLPTAVVIGRYETGIAISAVETFQFAETALFAVCYVDGLICIHECLSGDNILSLPLLTLSVSKIRIYQNSKDDPFVMAACIPQRIATQIFLVRIGLGEGYRGSMSIVKTLDLEVPVIDAEMHLKSKTLFVLTRMSLFAFNMASLGGLQTVLELADLSTPLGLTLFENTAILYNKSSFLPLKINDEGEIFAKRDIQRCRIEIDTGILFDSGSKVAFVHNSNKTVDLLNTSDFSFLRSIQLPTSSYHSSPSIISAHPIVLAKFGVGVIACGGDYLPKGSIFEIRDGLCCKPNVTSVDDIFHFPEATSQITSSHIILLKVPLLVAGFDSGIIRIRPLSAKLPLKEWKAHKTAITALFYIQSVLFCGSSDGEISVWSLDESPSCLATYDVHFNAVLRFIQINDLEVAATSYDNSFSLYRILGSTLITKVMVGIGHTSLVTSFLYNSWVKDAGFVISLTQDSNIYVWMSSTGALDRILKGKTAREFISSRGFRIDAFNEPCSSSSNHMFGALSNIGFDLNARVCTVNLVPVLEMLSAQVVQSRRIHKLESDLTTENNPGSSDGKNSIEFAEDSLRLAAALFIDWTLDPDLDKQISEQFDLFDPMHLVRNDLLSYLCFAMFGTVSPYKTTTQQHPFSMTLLLPSRWPATSRWRFSHRCTAVNSICISSIYMPLMSTGSTINQSLCSRLLANYGVLLPDALLHYKEPALRVLSAFSLHSSESVHLSARLLLQSSITRMSLQKKNTSFSYWSCVFKGHSVHLEEGCDDRDYEHHESPSKLEFISRSDEKLMCAMILCFLCVNHRFSLDDEIGPPLCDLLRQLIAEKSSDHVRASLAVDLIGKGARHWHKFLSPMDRVIFQLLTLSANDKGNTPETLQLSARRALLEVSSVSPAEFFVVIARILHNAKKNERISVVALECAADLVMKNPSSLLLGQDRNLVPATVKMIIHRLNPNESFVRKAILHPAISVFRAFALKFPIVKLHLDSQLVAFVSGRNISIYDLTSASKWKSLEGHESPIDAISFNQDGTMLASYCAKENPPTIRIWSLSSPNRGFMTQWLSASVIQSIRIVELALLKAEITEVEYLQRIVLSWTSAGIRLTREDRSIHEFPNESL